MGVHPGYRWDERMGMTDWRRRRKLQRVRRRDFRLHARDDGEETERWRRIDETAVPRSRTEAEGADE